MSSSFNHFWLISAFSSNFFFKRPPTIFSLIASGLPSRSSLVISSCFSFSISAAGTSSVVTYATSELAAICMATSEVNSLKIALLATKSVSLFTSTRTAILLLKWTIRGHATLHGHIASFLVGLCHPLLLQPFHGLTQAAGIPIPRRLPSS